MSIRAYQQRKNAYVMLLPIFVIKHRIIKFHFDQMFEVQE